LTSSADGSKLLATGRLSSVYRSVNYGANWTKIDALDFGAAGGEWGSVKCSSGFEVCLAMQFKAPSYENGEIFRSVDGGLTWAAVSGTQKGAWANAACHATGQTWVATLSFQWVFGNPPGGIYVSTDYGQSFTMVPGSDTNARYRSAACDATFAHCVIGTASSALSSYVLVKA
jgi:hypothetical protein